MCGYCTEQIVFRTLEMEAGEDEAPIDMFGGWTHYLQATSDVSGALNRIVSAAQEENVSVEEVIDREALFCRAIELIVTEGFDGPSYQQLLGHEIFKAVLAGVGLSVGAIAVFDKFTIPFNALSLLYDSKTFLDAENAGKLRDSCLWEADCLKVLNWYLGWWLEEGEQQECKADDSDPSHREYESLGAIFRCLFFSLLFLGSKAVYQPILWKLVCTDPRGIPFDGLDLWLQRQAAVSLYDQEGIEPFLTRMHEIRGSLIYYLDLKRQLSAPQKAQ